jgi:glutamate-1-semialdehyde 2,1-aminomutase
MSSKVAARALPDLINVAGVIDSYAARTPRSRALYERACSAMPGGDTRTATFFAPYPTFIDRAERCWMHDVDGHSYLDFLGNYTSLVHGHAHSLINAQVSAQLARGTVFGAPMQAQLELAERLTARTPSMHHVRFTNSGTEAVEMSIRAARAFTGRPKLLKFEGAYHGSSPETAVSVRFDAGSDDSAERGRLDGPGLSPRLLDDVLVAPYNDSARAAEIIARHGGQIAAVIVEPVLNAGGTIPAKREFLSLLREKTAQHGIILIVDEVVTFRLAYGGIEEWLGIAPDITVLGKLIGGGFPIGAFGGRADVLAAFDPRHPSALQHSGTFNGNAISMSAGTAALDLLSPSEIARINKLGEDLRRQFAEVLSSAGYPFVITGAGSLLRIHYGVEHVSTFHEAMRARRDVAGAVHLALMNHGLVSAPRGMFAVSTAMTDETMQHAAGAMRSAIHDVFA